MSFAGQFGPRLRRCTILIALVLTVTSLTLLLFVKDTSNNAKERRTEIAASQIATAICNHETEYFSPPSASDKASYVRALMGNNPRHIAFLSPLNGDLDTSGELMDAWGKPFLNSIHNHHEPEVLSPTMAHTWPDPKMNVEALFNPLGDAQREA